VNTFINSSIWQLNFILFLIVGFTRMLLRMVDFKRLRIKVVEHFLIKFQKRPVKCDKIKGDKHFCKRERRREGCFLGGYWPFSR